MSPPFVCVYASQVAMCIGANKHKKLSEAAELVWERCDPVGFRKAMKRNHVKTEDEVAQEICQAHSEVQELVDLTLTTPCESSDQVAQHYDAVAKELRSVPLADDARRLVDDVLKRNLYTTYGNQQEPEVLRYVRTSLGIACHQDHVFYKQQQGTCDGEWGSVPWYVGGKIDAIDDQRTLLIEIKNRVNRLFYRIPFYEQVQVQAYLHLLNLDKGVLVECLKTASPAPPASDGQSDGQDPPQDPDGKKQAAPAGMMVNVIPIKRDRLMWENDIVPKLQGFVDFVVRLVHDTDLQDKYLSSRRRSAMVSAFVNGGSKKKK